jgi:hypothetical protein
MRNFSLKTKELPENTQEMGNKTTCIYMVNKDQSIKTIINTGINQS